MKSVCLEAHELTNGARRESYGHPLDDYTRTVGLYFAWKGRHTVETAEDGACWMICVKMSREANVPDRENRVDACGYWNCLDMIIEERKRRAST